MASIYWDMEMYSQVKKIFIQSAEFCSEHEVWKLNYAHTFFMQARQPSLNRVAHYCPVRARLGSSLCPCSACPHS